MAVTQIRGAQVLDATITEDDLASSVAGNGISGGAGTALALDLSELSAAAVDVSADSVAILDATDSSTKAEAIADIVTAVAGDGLAALSGVLALDLNELTAVAVDVSADLVAIEDATDNSTKKESIADIMTATAGDGLGATSGVLAVNVDDSTVEINTDTVRVKAAGITNNELGLGSVDVDNLSDLRVTDTVGGITVDYAAGTIRNDNSIVSVSASTLLLTDDATNYVEVNSAGTVSANTTGFTSGSLPLAEVVTASGDISSVTDRRAWLDIEIGASGLTDADFVIRETPSGTINGVNTTFTLANTPTAGTEEVYLNGLLQNEGVSNDYTISGATITYNTAPATGDVLLVSYRK